MKHSGLAKPLTEVRSFTRQLVSCADKFLFIVCNFEDRLFGGRVCEAGVRLIRNKTCCVWGADCCGVSISVFLAWFGIKNLTPEGAVVVYCSVFFVSMK